MQWRCFKMSKQWKLLLITFVFFISHEKSGTQNFFCLDTSGYYGMCEKKGFELCVYSESNESLFTYLIFVCMLEMTEFSYDLGFIYL